MYVKIDGELKFVEKTVVKSNSTTIFFHQKEEARQEEEYKCYPDSLNSYHLRSLRSAYIYITSDIVCRNKGHLLSIIWFFLRIDSQLQCNVDLALTEVKIFIETSQSNRTDQMTSFTCSPGSNHYPFYEVVFKNLLPNQIRSQNWKF